MMLANNPSMYMCSLALVSSVSCRAFTTCREIIKLKEGIQIQIVSSFNNEKLGIGLSICAFGSKGSCKLRYSGGEGQWRS